MPNQKIDPYKKVILNLFKEKEKITSQDIADFFQISQHDARMLCNKWLNEGFIVISTREKKIRKYTLAKKA